DGGHLLVTTEGSDALLQVRLDGRIERVFDIGPGKGHMLALSPDGRHAYVAQVEAGTVARVELATGEVLEKPAGDGAEGIAVARDGSVWVSNREADTVTVHDPETLDVIATLDSPGFPIRVGFSADGQHALVTNARAATLGVFSVLQRRPLAVVALAARPCRLAPSPTRMAAASTSPSAAATRSRWSIPRAGRWWSAGPPATSRMPWPSCRRRRPPHPRTRRPEPRPAPGPCVRAASPANAGTMARAFLNRHWRRAAAMG